MEEVDSRFLHLLQPIRDLTKNWEVDVAAQLGEYLEELDQICISFDNGKTTMNFMEAALLIQGSACIYSRKVEYLYMLVCQTLDCISKKKREKLPTSLGPDGRDADATFTEKEEEFLSLDDIPETSQASVDMRRDQQPAAVNIVPLTPMSLVPPEEGEKKENPLLSRRGEVLASRRDFRMNTSTPHASGAFLLELAGLSPTHPQQEQRLGTATGTQGLWGGCVTVTVTAGLTCPSQPPNGSFPAHGGSLPAPYPHPHPHGRSFPAPQWITPSHTGHPQVSLSPFWVIPSPTTPRGAPAPSQPLVVAAHLVSPVSPAGRPFLVPHGLDDVVGGKRKRRGPRKLQDFTRWFSAAYNNVTEGRKSRRKGPTFADLEVLYWRQFKERLAAHRKLQSRGVRAQGCSSHQELLRELEPELEQERGVDNEEGAGAGTQNPKSPLPGESFFPSWGVWGGSQKVGWSQGALSDVPILADDDFVELEDIEPEAPEELEEGNLGELLTFPPHLPGLSVPEGPLSLPQGWLGALGRWHSLASLVAGQPPFEVCRYLLASLQLANDAEVELAQEAGLEAALDTARLRLLSARPAHERFQNFQLPSQRD
ncbi:CNDH2 protein, partial [Prunella himalayana]|nr:CNDH2 protein [Prunella himalayana]